MLLRASLQAIDLACTRAWSSSSLLRAVATSDGLLCGGTLHSPSPSPYRSVSSSTSLLVQQSTALRDQSEAESSWRQRTLYPESECKIGSPAPDFSARAVVDGEFTTLSLSQYKGKWIVLFFYPKDFTFVCPTEIIAFSDRVREFEKLNCQVIAASTDTEETHLAWMRTPRKKGGLGFMQIPIIADTTKEISARYGVLLEDKGIALRGLFIINPEGVLEQITVNNLPVGRSVDETLRLLSAFQFVAEHGEVCPAGWKPGSATMTADPEKSLEYFSKVEDPTDSEDDSSSKVIPVSTRKDFEKITTGSGPAVVDFYAPWCGKCRQIAPFFNALVDKYPSVKFHKFDTTADGLEALAADLNITALPAFRFYKDGKEALPTITGYKKKPLEEAVQKLAS